MSRSSSATRICTEGCCSVYKDRVEPCASCNVALTMEVRLSRARAFTRPSRGIRTTEWAASSIGRAADSRSEEHTSELQSQSNLVCRLLLEKKKKKKNKTKIHKENST